MKEEWKDIQGYEGVYQISSLGRVKSMSRFINTSYQQPRFLQEKMLSVKVDKEGYLCAHLFKNKKRKTFKIHRLIAIAFIPNPENKPQVNHKDSNRTNNSIDNLEWVTSRENVMHAIRKGNMKPPTRKSLLNNLQKRIILRSHPELSIWYLSQVFKVSRPTIRFVLENPKNIPLELNENYKV